MKFEPLVYFLSLNSIGPDGNSIIEFAEYDDTVNNPFISTYCFDTIRNGVNNIQTVWYDFYTYKYYYAFVALENIRDFIPHQCYIDVCFQLGGKLFAWVISPYKSILLKTNYQEINHIEPYDDWQDRKDNMQRLFDADREKNEQKLEWFNLYTKKLASQFNYRYLFQFLHREYDNWCKYNEEDRLPELDHININEVLFDGTHDKLNNGGLLKYHQAGKPKKLAVVWHIEKTEYAAYLWFHDDEIRKVFDHFYGAHPETKTDFIIRIDAENNKYELSLYRYGLKEPQVISEDAYQMIVFKNKFECYRSDNYDQPRGAWIW